MLEKFGRFFMSKARPLRVSPEASGNLPDDQELQALIALIEELPFEARYGEQNRFYEYLLGCHLLLPVAPGTNLSEGLAVFALENGHGEKALPVFSSEAALKSWCLPGSSLSSLEKPGSETRAWEPTEYLALPFDTLCTYALEASVDYIVMNAAGPFGCEISFHDFSYLAEGLLPAPCSTQEGKTARKAGEILVEKATPMRLSVCERMPERLISRLMQLFQNYQSLVSRVYLFDVGFNEGPLQPAVGVQVADGCESEWEERLWPNMQAVLCEMLERKEVVNVFLLNQAEGMEQHVRQVTEPVYISR
jgi:hypothetical protein